METDKIETYKAFLVQRGIGEGSLRHSFITRMLEEDVNIFKVQKIVGHSNIATTAGYTHLTTKDIVKAISKDPLEMKNDTPEEIITQLYNLISEYLTNKPAISVQFNRSTLRLSVVVSKAVDDNSRIYYDKGV